MTARTIKLVDTYCTAANWQHSIDANKDNRFYQTDEIGKKDLLVWAAKRDLTIAKLRLLMIELTDHEKQWIAQRGDGDDLARRFRALGIEPTWPPTPGWE